MSMTLRKASCFQVIEIVCCFSVKETLIRNKFPFFNGKSLQVTHFDNPLTFNII